LQAVLERLSNIEISKKRFYLALVGLVFIYVLVSFHEINIPDCIGYMRCFDVDRRERELYRWNFDENFIENFNLRYSLTMLLLAVSRDLFGSPRIFTLASSVMFLVLVALVGRDVSKSRFFGLVALVFMSIDPIFLRYDSSITYPNFWVTAFMFSVYLCLRKTITCFLPYLFSIPLKILTVLYFPVILFVGAWEVKRKIGLLVVFFAVILVALAYAVFTEDPLLGNTKGFSPYWFVYGLGMWAYDVKDNPVFLGFIFVSLFGLIILRKYNVEHSRAMLWSILYFLVNPAIYSGFSTFTIEPYRFFVMFAFVYISIAMVLKNLPLIFSDLKKKPF